MAHKSVHVGFGLTKAFTESNFAEKPHHMETTAVCEWVHCGGNHNKHSQNLSATVFPGTLYERQHLLNLDLNG